jgi:hypothetical protein
VHVEDLQLYRELTRGTRHRALRVDAAEDEQRHRATAVLAAWTDQLPEPVTPRSSETIPTISDTA